MATIRSAVVCGHCWKGNGTFVNAVGGAYVHPGCKEIYDMSHEEKSAKQSRKARRRRAARLGNKAGLHHRSGRLTQGIRPAAVPCSA